MPDHRKNIENFEFSTHKQPREPSRDKTSTEPSRELTSYINLPLRLPSSSLFLTHTRSLISRNLSLCSLSVSKRMPSRSAGVIKQDWEPVVMHKAKPKSQDLRDPKVVNHALRSGAPVQTIKKFDAGSNKKATAPVVNARKLEEETEPAALDRISTEVRQAIQKARLEKKMSQTELAKLINEQPKVVQEYENGKAVPNQAILAKMERVLGVKLRGKTGK